MDGFARAQAQYDAMVPPEADECPECDGDTMDANGEDCEHGFYMIREADPDREREPVDRYDEDDWREER